MSGSTTGLTRRQLTTVARTGSVHFVDMDAIALADPRSTHTDDVAEQLTAQLTSTGFPDLCVLRLVNTAEQVRELPSQDRATLSGRIARLVVEVIHDLRESQGPQSLPSGLYMTGGDLVSWTNWGCTPSRSVGRSSPWRCTAI